MAWTTPPTLTDGQVLTGAHTQIWRDDLLETGPAKATTTGRILVTTGANSIAERVVDSNRVSTAETTTSTSYAALATPGPTLTVTTGGRALVSINAALSNGTLGQRTYASIAISGATTTAAADSESFNFQVYGSNAEHRGGVTAVHFLTAGSNIFTMQYKVSGGTATISNRAIQVMGL